MDWYDKVNDHSEERSPSQREDITQIEPRSAEPVDTNAMNRELVEVVSKHDDTMLAKANAMLDD